MKKTTITRTITIDAPKEKVWEAFADFGNVQKMSPNISKSYLTSEVKNGLGATRHCDFTTMGAEVEEKITDWNEGVSLSIELYDPKNLPMMRGMKAHFELTVKGTKTILKGVFAYGMSSVVGDILNSLSMRKMNIKSWERFMAGIKHHVETDEHVHQKTKLPVTSVQA